MIIYSSKDVKGLNQFCQPLSALTLLQGDLKGIQLWKTILEQSTKVLLWGLELTCSNLWENTPAKQKPKVVCLFACLRLRTCLRQRVKYIVNFLKILKPACSSFFYCTTLCVSAGFAIGRCPSVRPSVTSVYSAGQE